ncbi:MAG: hypothetical protein IPH78_01930 [Bacteroidetes bacterium]|nr:hypothetical protein [Bacteroidota bacterium]
MEDQNQPITDDDKYVYGNVKRLKRQGLSISDADFVGEGRIWQQLFADYLPQFTALTRSSTAPMPTNGSRS